MSEEPDRIPGSVAEKIGAADTLSFHLKHPETSYEIYSLARRMQVGGRATSRQRIYLDTKYCVYLRDAYCGHPQKPVHADILKLLERLVQAGRIWCPISYDSFSEWMRQNADSRIKTAHVMDFLSGGIMLQVEQDRATMEISHFVWTRFLGEQGLKPMLQRVWLPVGYPVGECILSGTAFPPDVELAMQKSMFDVFSTTTMSDLALILQEEPPWQESDEGFQQLQTSLCARFREGFTSFADLFAVELNGVSDLWMDRIEPFTASLLAKDKTLSPDHAPENARDYAQDIIALIVSGLKLGRITTEIPCMHIPPSLHAAVRYKRQKFKEGDLHDFHHAIGALPYCNAFFTEHRLRNLLHDSNIDLPHKYNCVVLSDDEKIVDYLKDLSAIPSL